MSVPPRQRRWSGPTAEAAIVLVALLLALAAGAAGFVVGRETAEDDAPAAAETTTEETTAEATTEATTEPETTEPETTEPETTTAEATTEATTETGQGEDVDGAAVFSEAGCGACHVFTPADSSGTVGPSLDDTDLSKDEIEQQVRNGGGGMPAFGNRLSDAEIEAVADYVESG
jgi:mono/diheme cytochrome c family protein